MVLKGRKKSPVRRQPRDEFSGDSPQSASPRSRHSLGSASSPIANPAVNHVTTLKKFVNNPDLDFTDLFYQQFTLAGDYAGRNGDVELLEKIAYVRRDYEQNLLTSIRNNRPSNPEIIKRLADKVGSVNVAGELAAMLTATPSPPGAAAVVVNPSPKSKHKSELSPYSGDVIDLPRFLTRIDEVVKSNHLIQVRPVT